MGLGQPIADAFKLASKGWIIPFRSNVMLYLFGPFISFFISFSMWYLLPFESQVASFKWAVIWFLCLSSVNVYGVIVSGWASNSKYSMLGTMRGVAQVISYEISMGLLMLFPAVLGMSFEVYEIFSSQKWVWIAFVSYVALVSWSITMLAEVQRPPFDLAEGESELVSGYHVEYGGMGFTLLFLAEYGCLLLVGFMLVGLFFGALEEFSVVFFGLMAAWCSVWLRASVPRCRYDQLMMLSWKSLCPLGLGSVVLAMIMKISAGLG
uniref:NADH-ubiquinone oxidoreductase chain 1 n=1 Tax=Tegillarca granosa TaxID=220873 RepID=A0A0A7CIV6_TEGGR|nr:NADH dehydrogenase subunit 1 [Tegillarca granosa]AID49102.1 NADH dehydrogenase subunit 1 [Tegillarca granosa]UAJ48183.1 NADH dehydrogenase subunit 1 [Tegillarca granosa]